VKKDPNGHFFEEFQWTSVKDDDGNEKDLPPTAEIFVNLSLAPPFDTAIPSDSRNSDLT